MKSTQELKTIPDDELLRRLAELLRQSRGTEADLVAHLGEVDARRLYAREAAPSMFAYCTERLHLSDAEAYLRIATARAAREHPVLLEMLADGRLHLTAIVKLAPHITPGNRESLLARATHKSKRQIEELIAALAPRPDVPALIRKLPEPRQETSSPAEQRPDQAEPRFLRLHPNGVASPDLPAANSLTVAVELRPDGVGSPTPLAANPLTVGVELRPDAVARPLLERRIDGVVASHLSGAGRDRMELCPDAVAAAKAAPRSDALAGPPAPGHGRPPAVVEPLAPGRYRVQFTASAELRDKLERLRVLMRGHVPDGDLAAIIEQAVTEKLERLEARRFARTKASRKAMLARASSTSARDSSTSGHEWPVERSGASAAPQARPVRKRAHSVPTEGHLSVPRHIPAAVRRAVYERDEGRCRFVDERGRRCTAREGLEYHHRHPFGHGGRKGSPCCAEPTTATWPRSTTGGRPWSGAGSRGADRRASLREPDRLRGNLTGEGQQPPEETARAETRQRLPRGRVGQR